MNEVMNYIFGRLETTDAVLKYMDKHLRLQVKINRRFAGLAISMFILSILIEIARRQQEEEIERLSSEIEELKLKVEGE